MSIREYSMTRDSTRQLSPSFRVREFACKGSDVVLIDDELVVLLQCIREHFGKPVHITSGYRTAEHNAAVGGSKSSQHLLGRAADFYVEGVPVATVAAYAETLLPGRGGIGRYPKDAKHPKRMTGWVHIDTRTNKSRWKGETDGDCSRSAYHRGRDSHRRTHRQQPQSGCHRHQA